MGATSEQAAPSARPRPAGRRGAEAEADGGVAAADRSRSPSPSVRPQQQQANEDEREKEAEKEAEAEPKPVDEKNKKPQSDKVFVAFARIFSGTLRAGQKVHILGPRYDPKHPDRYCSEVELSELYMLMGKELEKIPCAPAGTVFGIGAVEDIILKTATVTTNPACPSFLPMTFGFNPIVRVAVEAKNLSEMPQLVEGLRLLNQADPCVKTLVQETGEHVIMASGELHLERCLQDLKNRFAKIEIEVSPPLVAFRETIMPELARDKEDFVEMSTPNKQLTIRLRTVPLPQPLKQFLEETANQQIIKKMLDTAKAEEEAPKDASVQPTAEAEELTRLQKEKAAKEAEKLAVFREKFVEAFKAEDGARWLDEFQSHLWALGPHGVGSNLLLNHVPNYWDSSSWMPLSVKLGFSDARQAIHSNEEHADRNKALRDLNNSIVSGFQLASIAGPLCNEPMTGVAFIVEEIHLQQEQQADNADDEAEEEDEDDDFAAMGIPKPTARPLGGSSAYTFPPAFMGMVISLVKEACRRVFLTHSVRIVEPMYLCDMYVSAQALGKVLGVLGKRRAQIVNQEMREGSSDDFAITAYLPVFESFGFALEMRDQTSGAANAQLVFSHWAVIDSDPFFKPTTQEELEEWGDSVDTLPPPLSKRIITDVRKRKGLIVQEKLVERADAQRNLSRKK